MNFLGVNFPGGIWTPPSLDLHIARIRVFTEYWIEIKKITAHTCIKLDFLIQHQIEQKYICIPTSKIITEEQYTLFFF